jgi:hypothetical protein
MGFGEWGRRREKAGKKKGKRREKDQRKQAYRTQRSGTKVSTAQHTPIQIGRAHV